MTELDVFMVMVWTIFGWETGRVLLDRYKNPNRFSCDYCSFGIKGSDKALVARVEQTHSRVHEIESYKDV